MGRKLRLDHRKSKSERPNSSHDKKLPLLVSFPLSRVYSKLTVSLPRTIFLHGEVNSPSLLKQRLLSSSSLSSDWVIAPSDSDLTVCLIKFKNGDIPSDRVSVISVTVTEKLQCNITAYGRLLPYNTYTLTSLADFLDLLKFLETSHLCPGNYDIKFIEVGYQRKGIFTDQQGI